MNSTTRNSGIELYRALLMFGICLLHAAANCKGGHAHVARLLEPCVDGFVFISGYYGVKFSFGRVVKLYAYAIACALVSVLMEPLLIGGFKHAGLLASMWAQVYDYWFLHAYVFMMAFAPLLNEAKPVALLPVVALSLGWSFVATFAASIGIVPRDPGFSAFSGLTLVGVYACARLYRQMDVAKFLLNKWVVAAMPVLLVAAAFGLGRYNSPIAVVLAATGFAVFERLPKVDGRLAAVLKFVGPSLFAVYLIQTTTCGFIWMPMTSLHWLLVTGLLFVGCLLLDIPRRVLVRGLSLFKGGMWNSQKGAL